jgi:osmoprotectant transport system permease protein
MLIERSRRVAEPLIRIVGVSQTVPSIALLAFMIALLGVGFRPALVALCLPVFATHRPLPPPPQAPWG